MPGSFRQHPAVRPRLPRQRPDVVHGNHDAALLPHHPAQHRADQRVRFLPALRGIFYAGHRGRGGLLFSHKTQERATAAPRYALIPAVTAARDRHSPSRQPLIGTSRNRKHSNTQRETATEIQENGCLQLSPARWTSSQFGSSAKPADIIPRAPERRHHAHTGPSSLSALRHVWRARACGRPPDSSPGSTQHRAPPAPSEDQVGAGCPRKPAARSGQPGRRVRRRGRGGPRGGPARVASGREPPAGTRNRVGLAAAARAPGGDRVAEIAA